LTPFPPGRTKIRLAVGDVVLEGELDGTACARAIADALPIAARAQRWGDEFYFEIPVARALDETATARVRVGDLGYWPTGKALCVFFGPTPMSTGNEPVPASEVNLVGRVSGELRALKEMRGELVVRVEKR